MIRWLSTCAIMIALVLSALPGRSAVAQSGVTVNIKTLDAQTGESIRSACFVLVDFSNIGCDENADGLIRYEGVPAGDYLVDQVQPAAGYVTVHNVPITVAASPSTQTFTIRLERVEDTSTIQAADGDGVTVYIHTIDGANQNAITDVCYVLVNASNEGCDDNGDGRVAFEGIAPGDTYTVSQTSGPAGYLPVGDFPIVPNMHDAEQEFDVVMS